MFLTEGTRFFPDVLSVMEKSGLRLRGARPFFDSPVFCPGVVPREERGLSVQGGLNRPGFAGDLLVCLTCH